MLAVVLPMGFELLFSEGPGLPDIPIAAAMETSQRPGSTEVQLDSTAWSSFDKVPHQSRAKRQLHLQLSHVTVKVVNI